MATNIKVKRKIFFTKSVGLDKEVKGPCPWKPGKSLNKFKN